MTRKISADGCDEKLNALQPHINPDADRVPALPMFFK